MTREEFMDIVYSELHSDGDNYRANRIIDAADEYAEEQTKWIPCSERMPEEHEWMGTKRFGTTISDEVYVTFESSKGERFCEHLSFQNGKLSSHDQSTINAFYKSSKPIAWMPRPQPYQPNEGERSNKNANT